MSDVFQSRTYRRILTRLSRAFVGRACAGLLFALLTFPAVFGCIPGLSDPAGPPWPFLLGDRPHGFGDDGRYYVFATAATFQGNFAAGSANWYEAADALCQSDANRPDFGDYAAFMVAPGRTPCTSANCPGGASENQNWVLAGGRTYFRAADGVQIMTTNESGIHLFGGGNLDNPMLVSTAFYWTGFDNNWIIQANNCSSWTSNSGGSFGVVGDGTTNDFVLEYLPHLSCDNFNSLLCVRL